MVLETLKIKLVGLGYAENFIEPKLKEFKEAVLDNNTAIYDDLIETKIYSRPTANISRFFLDTCQELSAKFVLDGAIQLKTVSTSFGSQITVPDYPLDQKLCIIGITKANGIVINMYNPALDVQNRFSKKMYEEQYGNERNLTAEDYISALTSGNRVNMLKAQDILHILMSEFIIDAIMIDNLNPKLKLYDNATKFAEAITNYELKYINRKVNKIEVAQKEVEVIYLGNGVLAGKVSNDPYLKLDELNRKTDFPLNRPTYAWIKSKGKNADEIAIYTATENSQYTMYSEVPANSDIITGVAQELSMQFSNIVGYPVSSELLYKTVSKLNEQLMVPSKTLINNLVDGNGEGIEPLKYRFRVITDPSEFEQLLYNSIEDNLGNRYRYRFVENVDNEHTTVGNKLNYTDANGKKVVKQSIADFNVDAMTAIIKRETIIDSGSVSQLLGYMYEDVPNTGTYLLPVPSIEVNFYLPSAGIFEDSVRMYNGTGGGSSNANIDEAIAKQNPNERAVTVKYINSEGEVLKENVMYRQIIGSVFVPEIIPVINDKEGKEWICDSNQMLNITISADDSRNSIEVKYIKKLVNVRINFINKQGKPVVKEIYKRMQVGEAYNSTVNSVVTDETKTEWSLIQARPEKLIVSENESKNIITLVYDVKKADVIINYKNKSGEILREAQKVIAQANKKYVATFEKNITDKNNLAWVYLEDSNPTVYVEEEKENVINLIYDEEKTSVVVTFLDEENKKIRDDIVEFIQVGKRFDYEAEKNLCDISGKHWTLDSLNTGNVIATNSKEKNVIEFKYKKMLSRACISFKTQDGRTIRDDIIKEAQIGAEFAPDKLGDITDVNGLLWKATDDNKVLKISSNQNENVITYKYAPYMTTITTRYIDAEGGELLPQKEKEIQVGSKFVPEKIQILEGPDGRVWKLSSNNIDEFVAKKYAEENIIAINYDKKLVDIKLCFKNVSGLVIKSDVYIKAQLGSEYKEYNSYVKVTSDNGEKWSMINTEPSRMYVKDGSVFTLIYDEIQARVLIKCVNVEDGKSIIDDMVINTKIGGAFAPNIEKNLIDRSKRRWKYIGEAGKSIIAKENDQENIITLNYEPEHVKVTVKYLNDIGQKIKQDFVKEEQIGNEVAIKQIDKISDSNELVWKFKSTTATAIKVSEKEEENIITCTYEKAITAVTTQYLNENNEEIIKPNSENVQIGSKYTSEIIDKVVDAVGKVWIINGNQDNSIKVSENGSNIVKLNYIPCKGKVLEKYVDTEDNSIVNDVVSEIQIGEIFVPKVIEEVTDAEGKVWSSKKIDNEQITISENEDKNIVTHIYNKKMIKVAIYFKTDDGKELKKHEELSLQIGSKYTIEPPKTLRDQDNFGWIVGEANYEKIISAKEEANTFEVIYNKYIVAVFDRFVTKDNTEIIKPKIQKYQVGTKYAPTVEDQVIDEEGKVWIQSSKSDSKIFASSAKVDPIVVLEDESKNSVFIKYKEKLANVTLKYENPLGEQIKKDDTVEAQVGSTYVAESIERVVGPNGNKWMYNQNSKNSIKVSEDETKNVIYLMYEEQKASVTFRYQDEYGTRLKAPSRKLVQIGTTYIPQFENIIEDDQSKVWEYKTRDLENIEVKDVDQDNIITLIYTPLKVDVTLKIVDKQGKTITNDLTAKAQLGGEFKPTPDETITDANSLMYKFIKCEPEIISVKETPIGMPENVNVITLYYEEVYSTVTIRYQDFDGNILRDDEKLQLQVGDTYVSKPIQFIKDKRENQWELVNNDAETIRVMQNEKDNIVKFVYEVAKANILVRYRNVDGEKIKDDESFTEQVGNDFIPKAEKFIYGTDNRKWNFFNADPIKLKVGSINNIVTLIYQEAKESVIVKYETTDGRQIKESDKILAQIGSRFKPKTNAKVIYEDNDIWRLDHLNPNEIIVSENKDENVITQVFTNKKVVMDDSQNQKQNDLSKVIQFTPTDELPEENVPEVEEKVPEATVEPVLEQEKFEFADPHLKQLEKTIKLSNEEKVVIQELNDYNTEIVKLLHDGVNSFVSRQEFSTETIEKYIDKEKDTIEEKLMPLVSGDKTGMRLLKIFEHITASEEDDAIYRGLQQKKAVLITDYYMNKPLSPVEQAMYICERGKVDNKETIVNERLSNPKNKQNEIAEYAKIKGIIMYEKIMLNNYYKARSLPKDNYFKDNNVRASMPPEIIIAVTNLLVKQSFTLLQKCPNMMQMQQVEFEALVVLLNDEQIKTLSGQLEKLPDAKQRKAAQRTLQDAIKQYKK